MAGTCARDRRALQQLALNVYVKHSYPYRSLPVSDAVKLQSSNSGGYFFFTFS